MHPVGIDGGSDGVHFWFRFRLRFKTHHQLAGDGATPLFDSSLESSQLPWRESAGHAFPQTEEQLFGIGVRLFVEPLLNLRPDGFKWVYTSAIGAWPVGPFAMCRTHFTIAPHRGKTGDETAQLR